MNVGRYEFIINKFLQLFSTFQMNTSPASAHPELGKSLIKYLRREVGEVDILLKKPIFHFLFP